MSNDAVLLLRACGVPEVYQIYPIKVDETLSGSGIVAGWDLVLPDTDRRETGVSILLMQDGTSYVGTGKGSESQVTLGEAIRLFSTSEEGRELGW